MLVDTIPCGSGYQNEGHLFHCFTERRFIYPSKGGGYGLGRRVGKDSMHLLVIGNQGQFSWLCSSFLASAVPAQSISNLLVRKQSMRRRGTASRSARNAASTSSFSAVLLHTHSFGHGTHQSGSRVRYRSMYTRTCHPARHNSNLPFLLILDDFKDENGAELCCCLVGSPRIFFRACDRRRETTRQDFEREKSTST